MWKWANRKAIDVIQMIRKLLSRWKFSTRDGQFDTLEKKENETHSNVAKQQFANSMIIL